MKVLAVVPLLCLFIALQGFGQDTTRFYFDENWQPEKKTKRAVFIKEEIGLTDSFKIRFLHSENGLLYEGNYSSLHPEIEHGEFKHLNDWGRVIEKGHFTHGRPDGIWLAFDPKTNTYDTLDYARVRKVLKKWAIEKAYVKPNVIVENPPSFPAPKTSAAKKYDSFSEYVDDEKHYSTMARKKGIRGTVPVSFIVGIDGKIYDIELQNSHSKYLDLEAARVIINSPPWELARQKGEDQPVQLILFVDFY
ncbi:MAG: energy transducer TonB [Bacteroidales bacterium]|nr:energy transducer TonB [Bacteroidales bacterium]